MKRLFALIVSVVYIVGFTSTAVAAKNQQIDNSAFVIEYSPKEWTVQELTHENEDAILYDYQFYAKKTDEYVYIMFYNLTDDAEDFFIEQVINKQHPLLRDALNSLMSYSQENRWSAKIHKTDCFTTINSELYPGYVMACNKNGGILFVKTIAKGQGVIKRSYEDLLNTLTFKPYTETPETAIKPKRSDLKSINELVEEEKNNIVYMVVQTMPEFPGGRQALFDFIKENLVYPESAKVNGIQGKAICQFIVEKNGELSNFEVVRSSGDASLDQEALRVLQLMPNWKPGKQRGEPVRVKYTVPVTFEL